MNDSSCVFEIICNTVQQSGNVLLVKEFCSTAGVSRSGYYAWLEATPARELQKQRDKKLRQSMSRRGNCRDNAPQEIVQLGGYPLFGCPYSRLHRRKGV